MAIDPLPRSGIWFNIHAASQERAKLFENSLPEFLDQWKKDLNLGNPNPPGQFLFILLS